MILYLVFLPLFVVLFNNCENYINFLCEEYFCEDIIKSIKNETEIRNTINAHIEDGVAMTKFLYWFKINKKTITEKYVENKLENFRKKSKNYLFPSFDTIAGSGPNGAIIH